MEEAEEERGGGRRNLLAGVEIPWYSADGPTLGGGGAGVARHLIVLLSAAAGAYWPLAAYRCLSLEPFPSAGGGAHRPRTTMCPPSLCLSSPSLLTPPSFPLGGCALDFPCFTALCRVHTEEANCPRRWPGASKWTPHTGGGERGGRGGGIPTRGVWDRVESGSLRRRGMGGCPERWRGLGRPTGERGGGWLSSEECEELTITRGQKSNANEAMHTTI